MASFMSGTSPKSRMPGRIMPPQTSQRGTPAQSATTSGGKRLPQPGQVLIYTLPWMSMTFLLPARWWRLSAFCVTTHFITPAASISASA